MDVDGLIASIIRDEDRVLRDIVEQCARLGPAMADALDRIVGPAADWSSCASNGDWWLRLHAGFILGLMGDAASGRLLVHLMRRLAAGEDANIEGWLAGYWRALLRNKPEEILPDILSIKMAASLLGWATTGVMVKQACRSARALYGQHPRALATPPVANPG